MKLTELLGLPYPEPTDTGALALHMEHLAFAVEEHLNGLAAAYDAFEARPCGYWTNVAFSAPAAANVDTPTQLSVTWDCTSPLVSEGDNPQSVDSTQIRLPANRVGLWAFGASLVDMAATTMDVESNRQLRLQCNGIDAFGNFRAYAGARRTISSSASGRNTYFIAEKEEEANQGTGTRGITADAVVWIPPGATLIPTIGYAELNATVVHNNTSAAVTIGAGSAYLWAVWLGYTQDTLVQLGV